MTPQMGVYTQDDADIDIAAHAALTVTHGTVDDVADQTDIENHRLDPDAHHSEEIAHGRPLYSGIYGLILPGVSIAGHTAHAMAANSLEYDPILVNTPITIDQFVFEVTIAAGAGEKIRAAIYRADIDWQPLDLVVASPEMAIDAIATVTQAIADTELQEGRYLIARLAEGAVTLDTLTGSAPFHPHVIATMLNIYGWRIARAYALGLADPGTAWTLVSEGVSNHYYKMYLRIATP